MDSFYKPPVSTMPINQFKRPPLPLAEGVGIFIGVVAWNLLSDGHLALFRALLVTIPCTLLWYAARYLLARYTPDDGEEEVREDEANEKDADQHRHHRP